MVVKHPVLGLLGDYIILPNDVQNGVTKERSFGVQFCEIHNSRNQMQILK